MFYKSIQGTHSKARSCEDSNAKSGVDLKFYILMWIISSFDEKNTEI